MNTASSCLVPYPPLYLRSYNPLSTNSLRLLPISSQHHPFSRPHSLPPHRARTPASFFHRLLAPNPGNAPLHPLRRPPQRRLVRPRSLSKQEVCRCCGSGPEEFGEECGFGEQVTSILLRGLLEWGTSAEPAFGVGRGSFRDDPFRRRQRRPSYTLQHFWIPMLPIRQKPGSALAQQARSLQVLRQRARGVW